MQIRRFATITFGLIALGAVPALASPSDKVEPRTAAAVEAADQAWGDAEAKGDKAYVNWLLLPDYQSVGEAGKSSSKALIIAHTDKSRSASRKAQTDAWKATHPEKPVVTIFGDTAVLAWTSTKPGDAVLSCDVFVYKDGHWHGIYSQHTTAGD